MAESYFLRLKNTLWEVIKPVEGMTGWGDGAETMGWGADETPSQSNIVEPEQPSQVGCPPFQAVHLFTFFSHSSDTKL